MNQNFTKFAFTESVKTAQEEYGSRSSYARMEESGDRFELTHQEIQFIESRDSFFMSTVGENGWPYMQLRGGPKGFLRLLDNNTLGMADFRGNQQFISVGNINANGRVCLFLIDYPSQQRLKIWAEARVVEKDKDPELLARVSHQNYQAEIERIIVFTIQAYDWNCHQHIVPRFTNEEIRDQVEGLDPDLIPRWNPDETKT